MDLKITSFNTFFEINGVLNRNTLSLFQKEFNQIFDRIDNLTISLEGLEKIDRYGVKAIAQLNQEAVSRNKSLSIVGYGCKDLYNYFTNESAA
ncbi:hypothetical protein E1J38_002410 [Seonamhaeicola sediminis]|uniref:STAS domain-containing protein n=1 Tax=Seonamhaeicola sediminis TaxID=2528206 RepID=A0A562YJ31_9FLAO|nr:STAS domain-containing protein [Seonamhaeicola sediminis]TWO34731.1 hypothetical protein E1J38_002410 [Seonamhaeicola sediminis]